MPIGSLHWVPNDPAKNQQQIRFTRTGVRTGLLCFALLLSILLGGSFIIGRTTGRAQMKHRHTLETDILRGELYQLERRLDDIQQTLTEVSEREERIVMTAAGLNLDFSHFIPEETNIFSSNFIGMFSYIDNIEMRLLLAERLAAAELVAYDSLASRFMELTDELIHTPSIWPVDGIFVSDFGPRIDPFTGAVRFHKGIDIAAGLGTPIYAPADGVVVFAGWAGGWGLNLVVRHSEHISTRFAHCSSIDIAVGKHVQRGDMIARVGSTGRSVAAHLHYEVLLDGVQIDPEDFIIRMGPGEAAF